MLFSIAIILLQTENIQEKMWQECDKNVARIIVACGYRICTVSAVDIWDLATISNLLNILCFPIFVL